MLRITKIADYGVVVMACFAGQSTAGVLSAAAIAAQTGLPAPTVSKILKVLAHAELVTSTRGARGGYRLSRAATEINVAEVIESLEGPLSITECADPLRDSCDQECCELRGYWPRINDIIRGALSNVSIADIAGVTGVAFEEPIETSPNALSAKI
jgi:FeS assembly SUF system regulator